MIIGHNFSNYFTSNSTILSLLSIVEVATKTVFEFKMPLKSIDKKSFVLRTKTVSLKTAKRLKY
jgi:hypothetical protein